VKPPRQPPKGRKGSVLRLVDQLRRQTGRVPSDAQIARLLGIAAGINRPDTLDAGQQLHFPRAAAAAVVPHAGR
jgi:hypothetical protein